MDVCIEGELIGRLVFELYKHLCPKTCANFAALCTGERGVSASGVRLSYVNSLFHRVVKGGWIQGGGGYPCEGNSSERAHVVLSTGPTMNFSQELFSSMTPWFPADLFKYPCHEYVIMYNQDLTSCF